MAIYFSLVSLSSSYALALGSRGNVEPKSYALVLGSRGNVEPKSGEFRSQVTTKSFVQVNSPRKPEDSEEDGHRKTGFSGTFARQALRSMSHTFILGSEGDVGENSDEIW